VHRDADPAVIGHHLVAGEREQAVAAVPVAVAAR